MSTIVGVLDNGTDYTHEDLYLNIFLNQGEIPTALAAVLVDTDADGLITFRDLNDSANASFVTDFNATGYIDGSDLLADPAWEDGVDTDGNGFVDDLIGWDFHDNDNDPAPEEGQSHGTSTAGIIGAIGDNGVGLTGINWKIQMIPARVRHLNVNSAEMATNIAAALNFVSDSGATISSNSWGGRDGGVGSVFNQLLYDTIDALRARDHLVITAAGNWTEDADVIPFYPGSFDLDNIINVASADEMDQLASFSSYGAISVDLAAASPNIMTTGPTRNDYSLFGGTSSARPQVTGIAALIRTLHSDWTYAQIKSQILSSVDLLPSLDGKTVTGGRLNAVATVSASSIHVSDPSIVEGNTGTTDLVFTVSRRGDTSGTATLDWSTAAGTAIAGTDYVAASGTIQFLAGETSQTITVQIVGDAVSELDETLFVDLSLVAGTVLIADSTSQGTILNDDTASPNDIYVSDIAFNSRTRGKGGAVHDEQIRVIIRRDSDADGVAEGTDELVAGANVTIAIPGTPSGTYSGVTDSNGVFNTGWIKDLPDGNYTATVTTVSHSSYSWNNDLDYDPDGNGVPDATHTIPHGASASSAMTTSSATSSTDSDTTDATTTQDVVLPPTSSAPLLGPALTEEEPDDESPAEDYPAILPEDQTDFDSLFGNLDGSLQEDLLTV